MSVGGLVRKGFPLQDLSGSWRSLEFSIAQHAESQQVDGSGSFNWGNIGGNIGLI